MMNISFLAAFKAVLQIFLMGSIGFILVRRGKINESGLKLLSWLSVNVCFPLFIFFQLIQHFNPNNQRFWWSFPLINVMLGLTGLMLALLLSRLFETKRQRQWMAVSGFHNAGYIPLLLAVSLPLAGASGEVYAGVILSIVGFDLCLWSLGVWLVTQDSKGITWRNFVNPPLMSMAVAFMIVLCQAQGFIPVLLLKPIKIMGDSALALAMLTIGGNLGLTRFNRQDLGEIFGAVAIKLCVLPTLALLILAFIPLPKVFVFVLMVQSCMPTAITLSIIARHHGSKDQDFINQSIFYSHLFSFITIPFFLGLYGVFVK